MKTCFVSIIGLPNSGKSTMLNTILDYDLSIVSYKPQTTRDQINGIYSEDDFQIVFVDTPGFQSENSLFSKVLNKNAISSLEDIDLALFLHPVNRKLDQTSIELAKKVLKLKNKIAILTKIDLEEDNQILAQKANELKQLGFELVLGFSEKYQVSKQDLLEEIKKYLYDSENYFDADFLTDRPMRFLAKEIIRKHLLLNIEEEIPHQVAIIINDFIENYQEKEQIYISAMIYVAKLESVSQKFIRKEIAKKSLISTKQNNKCLILDSHYQDWKLSYKKEASSNKKIGKIEEKVQFIDVLKEMNKLDGWNSNYKNGYKFIDLFSGAGGLSCDLVMAGFEPIASVEIMPDAVETYVYNFQNRKKKEELIETRDIRDVKVKEELYNKFKDTDIDLIVGGFPCQGFSMAGNRVVDDPRNSLYLEMLEIVKNLQPKFVLMENVQGLRTMLNGQVEQKIINDYKNIGYQINVTTLNSADYEVAQTRKRVIFIANKINKINYFPKPILQQKEYKTLGECIEKYMYLEENKEINHIFTKHSKEMQERIKNTPEGQSVYKNYSDGWKKSPWNEPSCTIKENHGGVNIHPKLPRVLTPRELAALQSFPDDFIFKGSKKWQLVQIGNAVPPLLAKAIGFAIKKSLDKNNVL